MRTARWLSSVAIFAALLPVLSGPALAESPMADQGVIHKVRQDETYEDLAAYYYGRRSLAPHLLLFNRRPEPLSRGTMVVIPTSRFVKVEPGQTLEDFARKYLSDAHRAAYLAELHGLSGRERKGPNPGRRLKVVPSLRHLVRRGESLDSIARYYYRETSPRRTKLLALYNHVSGSSLRPGSSLRIPLDQPEFDSSSVNNRRKQPFERLAAVPAVEGIASTSSSRRTSTQGSVESRADEPSTSNSGSTRASKRTPSRKDRASRPSRDGEVAGRPSPTEQLLIESPPKDGGLDEDDGARLALAADLYADGRYEEALGQGRRLLESTTKWPLSDRLELLRLVGFAAVAVGDIEGAKHAFVELLKLDPTYELDLYRTSPKILNVFYEVAIR